MSQVHIVAVGEHGPEIASKYGFASFDPIWADPQNESLRKLRKDLNVLLAGDEVYIPDVGVKRVEVAVDVPHVVRLTAGTVTLRLKLLDALGDPIASTSGTLTADGFSQPVATGADGMLTAVLHSHAKSATLTLDAISYTLSIGHLDPENTATGADARLVNLGYRFVEPSELEDDSRRPELRFATELFAHDQNLPTRSVADFLARLRELHGC